MGFVGFIWVEWIHSDVSCASSGSNGFVVLIRARPAGSFRFVGFMWPLVVGVSKIQSGAPCVSSGLCRFILARPGRGRFHSDSFGSFAVVEFIRDRLVYSGTLWGSYGSFGHTQGVFVYIQARPGGLWFHSRAAWRSLASSGFVGLIRARLVGRWVLSGVPWRC